MAFFSGSAWGLTCGLYQMEDFGDRVLYSITDFRSDKTDQIRYAVQNPGIFAVKGMLHGSCYCVTGEIQPDPEFPGDGSYQLIWIDKLIHGPYPNCVPAANNPAKL
jgi:hypothetical protein